MHDPAPVALQMHPFSEYLESRLKTRFDVVRWFELSDAEKSAFLQQRAAAVRAVITGGHIGCSDDLVRAFGALGIIAIHGVGVDKVNLALARERGIRVTTTPGTLSEDVADLAVGLTISLLRAIPASDAYVRAGHWLRAEKALAHKVTGRRFGIVGLGNIGLAIAARVAPFGPVAYTGPRRKSVPYPFYENVLGLAANSDVLMVACPANSSTRHLIGAEVLDSLGADGYLVNVSRGAVVDEAALIAALDAGRIAGAALDVFEKEPHVPAELCASEKVVLTPHVASATVETRKLMSDIVLGNLDAFLAGRQPPTAVV